MAGTYGGGGGGGATVAARSQDASMVGFGGPGLWVASTWLRFKGDDGADLTGVEGNTWVPCVPVAVLFTGAKNAEGGGIFVGEAAWLPGAD